MTRSASMPLVPTSALLVVAGMPRRVAPPADLHSSSARRHCLRLGCTRTNPLRRQCCHMSALPMRDRAPPIACLHMVRQYAGHLQLHRTHLRQGYSRVQVAQVLLGELDLGGSQVLRHALGVLGACAPGGLLSSAWQDAVRAVACTPRMGMSAALQQHMAGERARMVLHLGWARRRCPGCAPRRAPAVQACTPSPWPPQPPCAPSSCSAQAPLCWAGARAAACEGPGGAGSGHAAGPATSLSLRRAGRETCRCGKQLHIC